MTAPVHLPDLVEEYSVPSGKEGSRATVRLMADRVRERDTDPEIRARVRQLFAGLPSKDDLGEIEAVWNWLVDNPGFRYMGDSLGVEYVTDPLELDREIEDGSGAEDCESIAAYAATLFAASGRESQFVIMGKDPRRTDRFTHCALRVRVQLPRRGWVHFDPVGYFYAQQGARGVPADFTLGDSLHKEGELIEFWSLDGERVNTMAGYTEDNLFDATLGDTAPESDTSNVLDQVAAGASEAGPWGALVGGLIKAGEGVAKVVDPGAFKPKTDPKAAAKKNTKGGKDKTGKGDGKGFLASIPTWAKVVGAGGLVLGGAALLRRRGRR